MHLRYAFLSLIALALPGTTLHAELPSQSQSAAVATTQQTREAFLAIIDRPRVELAPEEKSLGVKDGIATFHFTFASESRERVPGLLWVKEELLQDGKRHPAAIVLHGTGGKKESELDVLQAIAARRMIAIAIDGRFHGERGSPADYNAAIAKAFTDGKSHPLYFDSVWDIMRLIDYLQTRGDVDPQRIGLMGISKGGIETWMTAAVDPRVSVAIPCISVQSFQWGLENDAWPRRVGTVQAGFDAAAKSVGIDKPDAAFAREFYDHLIPGIYSQFDGPKMLPLIAPRPLLVIAGDKDPLNPMPGLHLCEDSTRPAYSNALEKFDVLVQPNTAHSVTKQAKTAAVDWFEKWLRP